MRHWKAWLLLALAVWAGWSWWGGRPVARAAGVIAPDDPVQVDFGSPQSPIALEHATLHPLARFSLTARVLSREDYRFDAESALSPTDLALGWGRMSDSSVLHDIDVGQSGRFYHWQVKSFPIPRREIESHSANMHMVPANAQVAHALKRVRAGDVVTLAGLLVEADKPSGWRWRSSMARTDTGAGACELVYVQDLRIEPR
ncbi:MAG TPA: hypothetical protein VJL61_04190 [Rhodanobacteraceae bacterium]|nr:hypothetical protein [Rhodanobacteraceae bacterium]